MSEETTSEQNARIAPINNRMQATQNLEDKECYSHPRTASSKFTLKNGVDFSVSADDQGTFKDVQGSKEFSEAAGEPSETFTALSAKHAQ